MKYFWSLVLAAKWCVHIISTIVNAFMYFFLAKNSFGLLGWGISWLLDVDATEWRGANRGKQWSSIIIVISVWFLQVSTVDLFRCCITSLLHAIVICFQSENDSTNGDFQSSESSSSGLYIEKIWSSKTFSKARDQWTFTASHNLMWRHGNSLYSLPIKS